MESEMAKNISENIVSDNLVEPIEKYTLGILNPIIISKEGKKRYKRKHKYQDKYLNEHEVFEDL